MRKALMGVVLGGLVYFAASATAWMVFPWHDSVMKKLPEETLIRDTLRVVVKEPGLYFFPNCKTENGQMDRKQYANIYKSGPAGLMFYRPAGSEPMTPANLVISFIEALVAAGFSLWILTLLKNRIKTWGTRSATILLLGMFVWFNSHMPYWNWMLFPTGYILIILFDYIFCFGLMGLVVSRFVPDENPL